MPLNPAVIRAIRFPEIEHRLEERDCLLYALSLGLGRTSSGWRLQRTFERDLEVLPTQALVVGHPGAWITPETGITRSHVVQGGQRLRTFGPMTPGMNLLVQHRIGEVVDKGPGRGAIVILERTLTDRATGSPVAVMEWTVFCRNDGGFGGEPKLTRDFTPAPTRAADWREPLDTTFDTALLYRLNGDRNPIHADPEAAARAGFERPILHGLCLFGMAAAAISERSGRDIAEIEARFSSPSYPGEPLQLSVWQESDGFAFEIEASDRGKRAVDHGRIRLA